jgi:hypothetical protein
MKLSGVLLFILTYTVTLAQSKSFVPLEYEYPEKGLTTPKTYVYANLESGEFRYKNISRTRKGNDVIVAWKEYDSSPIADSSIEINDKGLQHYIIINGQIIKATITEDSLYDDGSKLGKKVQSLNFKVNKSMSASGTVRSQFLKDTIVKWNNKSVPCLVIESKSIQTISNSENQTTRQIEGRTLYYFGKEVGLLQYLSIMDGDAKWWRLTEIKDLSSQQATLNGEQKIYEMVRNDVCACLQLKLKSRTKLADLKTCVSDGLKNSLPIIQKEVLSKFPDSLGYEKGYEWGQMIGSKLDTDLVYHCDVYFIATDTLRTSMYKVTNKDSLNQILKTINNSTNEKNFDFFVQRSRTNFLLANYKAAHDDAEEVLKKQPENTVAIFIKAWYLESDKKFGEAALLYYQLDRLTGQHAYLVSAAINNRKQKEVR